MPTAADLNPSIAKQRSHGAWGVTSVFKILSNRTYTGIWHYGKNRRVQVDGAKRLAPGDETEWIPVPVPPIIDEATFQEAQAVSDRLRNDRKHEYTYEFLLRGRILCMCGYRCSACNASKQMPYYACPGNGTAYKVKNCSIRFRAPAPVLDAQVWQAVTEMLLDERHLREAIRFKMRWRRRSTSHCLISWRQHGRALHG